MIVTRTPLRISFAGGGSDYKSYFSQEPGCVVGATINQYIYVSVMPLPVFAEEEHRFTYRITESVQNVKDFKHPVVRTVLQEINTPFRTNISTMANLPGRSGLGSSSSFTVGLINGVQNLNGIELTPSELAKAAIKIEREILGEAGGLQDQYHASYGGLKTYNFSSDGTVDAMEVSSNGDLIEQISKRLVLVPMTQLRDSSKFAKQTSASIGNKSKFMLFRDMANSARTLHNTFNCETLSTTEKIETLISIINEGWLLKSELAGDYPGKSDVDQLISVCLNNGASAARLCGAGGSGFILLVSKENDRDELLRNLSNLNAFPIEISNHGSEIVVSESIKYSKLGVVESIL
jgi:D-glycero-alpha-D-manno-heptose-7-phosphate kinase